MPVGFIRRISRQSFTTTFVSGSNSYPALTDNWTTQQTATYVPATPAVGAAAYGGTVTDLDRELTATGSGYTIFGLLLTFLHKPPTNSLGQAGSFGGVIVKVTPTFTAGSTAAFEVWSLKGAVWTKRRRIALAGLVRSGETIVIDATGPVLSTTDVDAYWITLAPDIGTETLTWLAVQVYGICLNDPVTPDCPPGTPPADCDAPECGVDVLTWLCLDPPAEPIPAPTPNPFVFPPVLVQVPNPTTYVKSGINYFHNCPRPTLIVMHFGLIPGGGSVTVTPKPTNFVTFVEGASQTISAAGDMTWTVLSGFVAANSGSDPALPPAVIQATTDFLFTRQLDGTAFAVAGNLLDILMYYWFAEIAYQEVC